MAGYIGNIPAPEGTQDRTLFTATAAQTVFTLPPNVSYTPGYVDVFLNGSKLINGTDFTALDGTIVTLIEAAELNDNVEIVSYSTAIVTGNMTASETAPINPADGDFWFKSDTGVVYIYYNDVDSGQWVELYSGTAGGWVDNGLAVYYNGANNVGIGVTNPGTKLTVDGGILATGDITAFGSVSDINTKQNVEPITDAMAKVSELNGVTFEYKETPGERMTGLIAQDVEKVLPEAVYEATPGTIAVRYHNMIGLLVEALKEQQAEIDELKRRLDGSV